MKKQCLLSAVIAVIIILVFAATLYKPPIKNATAAELDAIFGIKYDGVIIERIHDYIEENPDCSVEDLRVIKGVDDMIIEQLERKWR